MENIGRIDVIYRSRRDYRPLLSRELFAKITRALVNAFDVLDALTQNYRCSRNVSSPSRALADTLEDIDSVHTRGALGKRPRP